MGCNAVDCNEIEQSSSGAIDIGFCSESQSCLRLLDLVKQGGGCDLGVAYTRCFVFRSLVLKSACRRRRLASSLQTNFCRVHDRNSRFVGVLQKSCKMRFCHWLDYAGDSIVNVLKIIFGTPLLNL